MRVVRGLMGAFSSFMEDDCPTLAAALAYYTVFSLAALDLLAGHCAHLITLGFLQR